MKLRDILNEAKDPYQKLYKVAEEASIDVIGEVDEVTVDKALDLVKKKYKKLLDKEEYFNKAIAFIRKYVSENAEHLWNESKL
jgi:hypothetical protein